MNVKINFFITTYFDFINCKNENHLLDVGVFIKDYINKISMIYENFNFHSIHSIYENIEITNNDYLFITEIYSNDYMNYIFELLPKFNKNNIIFFGFECQNHPCHKYKLTNEFFNKIGYSFCNYDFNLYNFNSKNYFIPTYHFIYYKYQKNTLSKWTNFEIIDDNIKLKNNINVLFNQKKFIINNPYNGYNEFRNKIIYKFKDRFNCFKFYGNDINTIKYFKNDTIIENNIGDTPPYKRTLYKMNKFIEYKFILIVENSNIYSYISEKIIDCITSGSLPIYYGYHDIDLFFPDLFDNGVINGHKYSFNDLFKLLETMNEEEYNIRLNNIKKHIEKYFILFSEYTCIKYLLYNVFDFIEQDEYTLILDNINKNIINKYNIN